MEEKLILKHRGDYDYFLLSRTENSEAVQASLIPDDEFEQKLSKQNCDDIFGIYSPSELSQILVEKYNGIVPQSFEALETLPGVGHKTASVVMSQAFGFAAFPVDTHIHRLLTRWGITSGKNVVQTELDAKKLFPEATWNKLHLQIIFYGREYSPARSPKREKDFMTLQIGTAKALKELC